MSSGLRRGEPFALRWRDFDEQRHCVTVREAVYQGTFSTPNTACDPQISHPFENDAIRLRSVMTRPTGIILP